MDVKLLSEELTQNIARRDALRADHNGKTMPKEAREEFQTLTTRSAALIDLIDVEEQKANDKVLDEQKALMEKPVYKIPMAMRFDDPQDGSTIRKTLQQQGWELKGGVLHAPLSNGKSQPMYPEEVLFGAVPDEVGAASYYKQTRDIFQPEYRAAWIKWFRNAPYGEAYALTNLTQQEQQTLFRGKALSEGSDTAGGFTVPPDIAAEIGGRRAQVSVMRGLATVRQTIRDQWSQPMVAPNSTASTRNIFSDDFVAAWVGETPSQASIDVAFDMFTISIKKVRAYTLLSNDLIADSVGNLLSELAQRGGRSLGRIEDKGFLQGSGLGLEPLGILNHSLARTATSSNGMAYDVEGTTANTISNTVSDAGSAPKIKQLVYTLPSQYAQNASWLMQRATQGHIAGLVDANGRPFWNSYLDSGFSRPMMQIEGFPVSNSEFVGADGSISTTAATTPLVFGDISEYNIIERMALSVRVLTERFGDTDQTGLFLFSRVGGGLWNYDAIRTGYIAS